MFSFLSDDLNKKIEDILNLSEIKNCPNICPKKDLIFRAIKPREEIKILILGQDPYHTEGVADGYAFSSSASNGTIPPSLKNIFKEIENCGYPVNKNNANLERWAIQGVCLLNTALTTEIGVPLKHSHIWKNSDIIEDYLHYLSKKDNLVVMLWGNHAKKYSICFENSRNCCILTSGHPSPYSSHLFLGNSHFRKANDFLISKNILPINWN